MMRAALPAFATLLLARPASAAAEGGAGVFWEIFNLALVIGVLVYFARKPVLAYLAERRSGIEGNIQSAEQVLSEAEARLSEWSTKVDRLDEDMATIREAARKSAEDERTRIIAEAQAAAQRILASAGDAVQAETRRAQVILREEAADLAVELAEKILREQVGDADQARLVDEFIAKVEQGEAH